MPRQDLVSSLASRGVYTLLDLHQDCLWQAVEPERQDSRRRRKRKGYWGVPPWVKRSLPRTEPSFPWPLGEYQAWICGYFTKEISSGFQVMGKNQSSHVSFQFFLSLYCAAHLRQHRRHRGRHGGALEVHGGAVWADGGDSRVRRDIYFNGIALAPNVSCPKIGTSS